MMLEFHTPSCDKKYPGVRFLKRKGEVAGQPFIYTVVES